jgi:hypothetical protein
MGLAIRGVDALEARCTAIAERLANALPFFEIEAERVRTIVDDAYMESQSPSGDAFAPVKAPPARAVSAVAKRRRGQKRTTQARQTSQANSHTPLIDTGLMRRTTMAIAKATGMRVGFGTNYGGIHATGGRKLPQRNVLPFEFAQGVRTPSAPTRGNAGKWWADMRKRLSAWVVGRQ